MKKKVTTSLKTAVNEFKTILDAECEVLKKDGRIQHSADNPWRYYDQPADDEHEFDHLRAVLEAGRMTVIAESYINSGNELGAWRSLSKAQQALLNFLSAAGKKAAKKRGNSKGGLAKNEGLHYKIFCIADDLLASGHSKIGLEKKVSDELSAKDNIQIDEIRIGQILKKIEHKLTVN